MLGAFFDEEELGSTGTMRVENDIGTKDDKGLSADGMMAGDINAAFGHHTMVISFAVPVAEQEIDD